MAAVSLSATHRPFSPQVYDYYADKVRTSVVRTFQYANAPGDYRWVRNFTCFRYDPLGLLGTRTRYPKALKNPELRRAIALKAKDVYAEHGYKVNMSMVLNPHLGVGGGEYEVGYGYELLATFVGVPAKKLATAEPINV